MDDLWQLVMDEIDDPDWHFVGVGNRRRAQLTRRPWRVSGTQEARELLDRAGANNDPPTTEPGAAYSAAACQSSAARSWPCSSKIASGASPNVR